MRMRQHIPLWSDKASTRRREQDDRRKGATFMYNVLLVDDEPGHLTGLSRLLRKLRPDYRVQVAKNGEEALQSCYATSFEIIISDIQMPLMDGLEFFERLPSSRRPQKVIFLTGYDYFEYAQKAIGLGSFEYVLKPVDLHKFTQVLEKAESSVARELESQREKERISARLDSIMPIYHNRILSLWVHGEPLTAIEEQELRQTLLWSGCGALLAISCRTEAALESGGGLRLKASLQTLFDRFGGGLSFQSEQDRSLLICAVQGDTRLALMEELERELALPANESVILYAGISAWSEELAEQAPALLRAACSAALEGFYRQDRLVFESASSQMDPRRLIKTGARDEALLHEAVQAAEAEAAAEQAAAKLLARLVDGERLPSPAELILSCRKLLVKLVESADYLPSATRDALAGELTAGLETVRTKRELERRIAEALYGLAAAIREARRDSKEAVIYKCLAYIDEHYMEDLSLESVSAQFHFNSSYFCHYFKSKLNINFSQYLTQTRLAKAKELLEQSNDKVYQVAARLGYQDVKYFNRVFKKEFGLTPEEYRTIARSMRQA